MSPEEKTRLNQLKKYEEKGQVYFNLIENYYQNEELLNSDDILERQEATLRIVYARRQYLIESTYNDNGFGQLKIYEAKPGTEFWPNPEFIFKPTSSIFYDNPGNIYIGGGAAHMNPEQSAEDLLREITK